MFMMEFKPELDLLDIYRLQRGTIQLFSLYIDYCKRNNLPCLITSLKEDAPGRKSSTHTDGRAFDASIRCWADGEAQECADYFNGRFARDMGTAPRGKEPKVCVYHDAGTGDHLHFQVRRGL